MKFDRVIETGGDGFWSDVSKKVKVTELIVDIFESDDYGVDWGELRVFFDIESWDCHTDGLIYTDSNFLACLKKHLTELGLASGDIEYSEQGMQGIDYVSLDVSKKFLRSWQEKA